MVTMLLPPITQKPTHSDCNGDGIGDVCAIDAGEQDTDFDGRPAACEVAYGDFNLDGAIGGLELSVIIGGDNVWIGFHCLFTYHFSQAP